MVARGVTDIESAGDFLTPKLSKCADPASMKGVREAAELICGFIGRNEKITVFSDYDADGITGAAIMRKALALAGACAEVFLPDRAEEGYGFTEKALKRCLAEFPATRLLLTVDCGVSQCATVRAAVAAGVSVVISDHHEQTGPLPAEAAAVLLPYAEGNPPAVRDLCGAGVAFKLAHQILRCAGAAPESPGFLRRVSRGEALEALGSMLPLAALGTVADVVPLTGENRILAAKGLEEFNKPRHGRCHGLDAIREASDFAGVARSEDFGFVFGPRINASGRIADPGVSLRLLLSENRAEALPLARELEENNGARREFEAEALKSADGEDFTGKNSIVFRKTDMRAGVAGLVASRLAERANLPAVALFGDDAVLRGSARCPAIGKLSLTELLGECADLLVNYGGHRAAAGLSVEAAKLGAFREAFDAACGRALAGCDRRPRLRVDAWLDAADISPEFRDAAERLQPFGEGNPPPLFAVAGAILKNAPRQFGKTTVNWELSFAGIPYPAVIYRCEELPFAAGDELDVFFAFSQTRYDKIVLDVRDVRPHCRG